MAHFKEVPTFGRFSGTWSGNCSTGGCAMASSRSTCTATTPRDERWSFLDGPITANNPMGVHHAWGRTYKDLFQRYHDDARASEQRYQNGFDCQGLWVEVEVEKELGFKSKRDIETYGVAEFVEQCKERVLQVRRASRPSSRSASATGWTGTTRYYTMSDENNYTIWHFLKTCHERGWIYKGHDVMPWCPRCGTGISEHEIVTEGYQERTHLLGLRHASRCSTRPTASAAGLDDDALDAGRQRRRGGPSGPDLRRRSRQDGETYYLAKDAAKNGAPRRATRSLGELQGQRAGRPRLQRAVRRAAGRSRASRTG